MTISFVNPGLIDLLGVRVLGVSAKEGDNPIGYFGTGLKYAIAIILRHGGRVQLWRGEDRHTFDVRPTDFRGSTVDVVTLDGEDLGFTTHLGKNWELWQAYRELYCNALDEGGDATATRAQPREGFTTIWVDLPDFEKCHAERSKYFLSTQALQTGTFLEVHPGPSDAIYYRGILAYRLNKPTALTYNLVVQSDLTEDRTLKSLYMAHYWMARFLVVEANEHVLRKVFRAGPEYVEQSLDLRSGGGDPSPQFLATIAEVRADVSVQLNPSALSIYSDWRMDNDPPTEGVELDDVEERTLEKAKTLARLAGADLAGYPIIVVENLGDGVLGRAAQGRIFLSRRAFLMGTKVVAGTIFEEWAHCEHKFDDCTRQFQNFLIDALITGVEKFALREPA